MRVSIIVKNEKVMIFPAVTICNNNPLKKSKSGALDNMIKDFENKLKNSSCFSSFDYSTAYYNNWKTSMTPNVLNFSTGPSESSYPTTPNQSKSMFETSSRPTTRSKANVTFSTPRKALFQNDTFKYFLFMSIILI